MPPKGIDLLTCLKNIPGMRSILPVYGANSSGVISNHARRYVEKNDRTTISIIFQPNETILLEDVYNRIEMHPSLVNITNVTEMKSGCILELTYTSEYAPSATFKLPGASQDNIEDVFFFSGVDCCNEFALFYISLFILGSYARYYPDKWMVDVENSTPLALASFELILLAERRVPLLSLSEFTKTWHLSG